MAFNSICTLLWLSCTIAVSVCVTTLEKGPQNKTVFEGDSTSLFCDFSNDNDKPVIWTRVDSRGFERYVSHDNIIYPQSDVDPSNYDVVVDQDEQSYELVFKSAQVVPDQSLYQCGYQYGQNALYKPLATAYLTVLPQEYSFTCEYLHLPLEEVGGSAEVEVLCVWNRDVVTLQAAFRRNGEDVPPDVVFPDRIISRSKLTSVDEDVMLNCALIFNVDGSMRSVTKQCVNSDRPSTGSNGVIRVDPFINEVQLGSDAVFSCTADNQRTVFPKFWNIVNMTNVFLSLGNRIDNGTRVTIRNVHEEDENLLIECRALLPGNIEWVSSFATIRVVSSTTVSQTSLLMTSNYETTLRMNGTVDITKSPAAAGRTRRIVVAIVIIFLVIIMIVIIIVAFIRRRKQSLPLRSNRNKHYSVTYGTNISKEIPHVFSNGGQLTYAVSFKDKRVRNNEAKADGVDHIREAPEGSSTVSVSEIFHHGRGSRPSRSAQSNISRFRSLPMLDDKEYEMVSYEDIEECQVPRSKSMTSIQSNSSNKRWTSQKMRRSTMKTPPRGRRALSYRRPTRSSDPNVSTEYAQMSIKSKSGEGVANESGPSKPFPVYAKPDKTKKTNRHKKSSKDKPELENDNSYAVSAIASVNSSDSCSNGHTLAGRPNQHDPLQLNRFMKKDILGKSLHVSSASSAAPPKPKRGKCQSQFLANAAYSVVSDYEIMAQQFKNKKQTHVDSDAKNTSKYDRPQESPHRKSPSKDFESETVDGDHGNSVYEMVDDVDRSRPVDPSEVVTSPHYASINEAVYAFVDAV